MTDTISTNDPMMQPQSQGGVPEREEEKDRKRVAGWWWRSLVFLLALALIAGGVYYGIKKKSAAAKQKIDNAFVFRIDGNDSAGRHAAYDFIILTDEYTWVKGSTSAVESHGQAIPTDQAAERVLTPNIRASFGSATDLIAVGLASSEGDVQAEEQRAVQRAQTIAGWMSTLAKDSTPIWSLTLGQYSKGCKSQEDADTSFERPLIMAAVRQKDNGVNLQEALADAVSSVTNLPDRKCYSQFSMSKVR